MKKIASILLVVVLLAALCSTFAAADADAGPFSNMGPGIPNYDGDVYVTKDPYTEHVTAGSTAKFVSHASNSASPTWYIANEDKSEIYSIEEASQHFNGLSVKFEDGNSRVILENVPAEMDNWMIQARFEGQNGPVYSTPASIHILTNSISPAAQWWWTYCTLNGLCPYCGK